MTGSVLDLDPISGAQRRPAVASNIVVAVTIFVVAEVMFFCAFVSAFTIARANAGSWPPPGQPHLPIEATALNTALLLLSGAVVAFAAKRSRWLAMGAGLGASFVVLQGVEWVALIREGLTLRASQQGAFFYLIVGAHALHASAGVAVLLWALWRATRARLDGESFKAARIYWTFVVVLWPLLYWRVYL